MKYVNSTVNFSNLADFVIGVAFFHDGGQVAGRLADRARSHLVARLRIRPLGSTGC
jgi:hypothetical protein